jgi:CopG family nickel-responsive transcriptional regulator
MTSPEAVIRFSVSLPEQLLEELDRRVTHKGYASRSELVRDLIRERLVEEAWEKGEGDLVGVLTIVYDHHQRELSQRLIDIQHYEQVLVICTTHVHLDQHNCLETIMVRGCPEEIGRITTIIGGLKGVKLAKLTRTARLRT